MLGGDFFEEVLHGNGLRGLPVVVVMAIVGEDGDHVEVGILVVVLRLEEISSPHHVFVRSVPQFLL